MPSPRIARWRSPLLAITLAGLLFALLSGSALLFFGMPRSRREYWVLVHWLFAMLALLPYTLYQLRHWLRVRRHARRTHYRVGRNAFIVICATVLTGLPLVFPLDDGTRLYAIVDLAHIFFGFVFALLVAAHLALVAGIAAAENANGDAGIARTAVRSALAIAAGIAIAGLIVAISRSS